jgi:hypothetical protein
VEILKSDMRSITLETFSIDRDEAEGPVTIRAEIQIEVPSREPPKVRLRVKYEAGDIPQLTEHQLGQHILGTLRTYLSTYTKSR